MFVVFSLFFLDDLNRRMVQDRDMNSALGENPMLRGGKYRRH